LEKGALGVEHKDFIENTNKPSRSEIRKIHLANRTTSQTIRDTLATEPQAKSIRRRQRSPGPPNGLETGTSRRQHHSLDFGEGPLAFKFVEMEKDTRIGRRGNTLNPSRCQVCKHNCGEEFWEKETPPRKSITVGGDAKEETQKETSPSTRLHRPRKTRGAPRLGETPRNIHGEGRGGRRCVPPPQP